MKKYFAVAALLATVSAAGLTHAAGPDLRATIIGATELANGFDQRITIDVQNVGAARAGTVTQTLRFSSQVTLLESPSWCPVTTQGLNKVITCSNSKLNAGARLTTAIRIRAPQPGNPTTTTNFVLTASTVGDTILGNNTATLPMTFSATFAPPVIQPPLDQATMTTCSGSAPFEWSVCSASSNQSNQIELDSTNQVLFQGSPVGFWSKPTASTLLVEFVDNSVVEATYNLETVSTSCYRGIGLFPNSTWFARMELCF
jgi:hypothetical protein